MRVLSHSYAASDFSEILQRPYVSRNVLGKPSVTRQRAESPSGIGMSRGLAQGRTSLLNAIAGLLTYGSKLRRDTPSRTRISLPGGASVCSGEPKDPAGYLLLR